MNHLRSTTIISSHISSSPLINILIHQKARRHLQPGKGFVSSGKGGTETSHSSDDRSGDVISRSTGSGGKGSYGKGSANDLDEDTTGAVVDTGLSATRPATGGKGTSSLGKGGIPSSGKGTSSGGKGSTTTSPDELLREDSNGKKSDDNKRDASSGDDVGTSSTIPPRSDDENTFDLEPAEFTPNEIGNNRNFGSLSNDDP